MRSPIISEIFPTPEERFNRERQEKEQAEAQAAEDAALGLDAASSGPPTLGAEDSWGGDVLGSTARSAAPARGSSRDAYGASGGASLMLDGEEAMEQMIQSASEAFNKHTDA